MDIDEALLYLLDQNLNRTEAEFISDARGWGDLIGNCVGDPPAAAYRRLLRARLFGQLGPERIRDFFREAERRQWIAPIDQPDDRTTYRLLSDGIKQASE